jgi:hypothetical protein
MLYPDTIWIPQSFVFEVERDVAAACSKPMHQAKKPCVADDIVDECQDGHLASNENVPKASKTFFAETAIMALLCRHNCPLFLVNMTSAGERQHYAIALLRRLMDELPLWWRVNVLYDIACVLERSCVRWNLMGKYLPRMQFAVSVFHAYSHRYACQVLYHPRKRPGCGLFDGESCERFWSSLKCMISILRVTGVSFKYFDNDCSSNTILVSSENV